MTIETIAQFLIPLVVGFVLRHVTMPASPGGSLSFPTSIGHGEVISWLLAKVVAMERAQGQPGSPAAPTAPAAATDLSAELTAILKQVLAAQQPAAKPA